MNTNAKTPQEKLLTVIKEMKHKKFGSVTIGADLKGLPYKIILLSADCAEDRGLMETVGRWRKKNEMWFLSQFPVTVERTTCWFKDKVTAVPDRLLFIIKVGDEYIGHIGLFRFEFYKASCEIDNIVRGETKYPGIMGDAILHMMKWGIGALGIKEYTLKVLSDNERAIRLYNKIGYAETGRIPLIQVQGKDGLEWTEAPQGYSGEIKRAYVVMRAG